MPPVLLCQPTTSWVGVGGMAVESEPFHQYYATCCCHARDGSTGQSDRMVSHVEVWMKQRCLIEFRKILAECRKCGTLTLSDGCRMFIEPKQWM